MANSDPTDAALQADDLEEDCSGEASAAEKELPGDQNPPGDGLMSSQALQSSLCSNNITRRRHR